MDSSGKCSFCGNGRLRGRDVLASVGRGNERGDEQLLCQGGPPSLQSPLFSSLNCLMDASYITLLCNRLQHLFYQDFTNSFRNEVCLLAENAAYIFMLVEHTFIKYSRKVYRV